MPKLFGMQEVKAFASLVQSLCTRNNMDPKYRYEALCRQRDRVAEDYEADALAYLNQEIEKAEAMLKQDKHS